MAIWQVACYLVNKDMPFLSDVISTQSLDKMRRAFPEEKSWSNSIKQYGATESTCMEISCSEKGEVEDIYLRIDLRSISPEHLQTICDFAKANDLFIMHDDVLYIACMDSFAEIIQKSDAYRFLTDQQNFFEELS